MKRIRYEGNEIIYTDDSNNNGDYLVENLDELTGILGADMIVTGMVVSEATVPDMTVQITAGIAKDTTTGHLLSGEAFTNVSIPAADATLNRVDIIEIKRLEDEITPATRQFKDPTTETISSATIDTETSYITEVKVLSGTPGSIAPAVESGYIKICEILVPAASTTVTDTYIYNVDAEETGGTNTSWTNGATSIYRNGSISDMKTSLEETVKPSGSGFLADAIATFVGTTGKLIKTSLKYFETALTNSTTKVPVSSVVYGYVVHSNVVLTSTQTYNVVDGKNYIITLDTSSGSITITLGNPSFIGQKIVAYCDGSGLAYVKGSGIYDGASATGTPISDGLKLELIAVSLTEWKPTNEVTADYVSTYNVIQTSGGMLKNYADVTVTWAGASGADLTVTFGVPFSTADYSKKATNISTITGIAVTPYQFTSIGTTGTTFTAITTLNGAATGSANFNLEFEGSY